MTRLSALPLRAIAAGTEAQALLLYGGANRDVFAGCLSCSEHDGASICDECGAGSRNDANAVFHPCGTFGSGSRAFSPWNKSSVSGGVPVIGDSEGNFCGYFTIDGDRPDASNRADELLDLYEAVEGDLGIVRNFICG